MKQKKEVVDDLIARVLMLQELASDFEIWEFVLERTFGGVFISMYHATWDIHMRDRGEQVLCDIYMDVQLRIWSVIWKSTSHGSIRSKQRASIPILVPLLLTTNLPRAVFERPIWGGDVVFRPHYLCPPPASFSLSVLRFRHCDMQALEQQALSLNCWIAESVIQSSRLHSSSCLLH